jgi:hypothetical protein
VTEPEDGKPAPAPWTAAYDPTSPGWRVSDANGDEVVLVSVDWDDGDASTEATSRDRNEPVARLLAAAPRLLNRLRQHDGLLHEATHSRRGGDCVDCALLALLGGAPEEP